MPHGSVSSISVDALAARHLPNNARPGDAVYFELLAVPQRCGDVMEPASTARSSAVTLTAGPRGGISVGLRERLVLSPAPPDARLHVRVCRAETHEQLTAGVVLLSKHWTTSSLASLALLERETCSEFFVSFYVKSADLASTCPRVIRPRSAIAAAARPMSAQPTAAQKLLSRPGTASRQRPSSAASAGASLSAAVGAAAAPKAGTWYRVHIDDIACLGIDSVEPVLLSCGVSYCMRERATPPMLTTVGQALHSVQLGNDACVDFLREANNATTSLTLTVYHVRPKRRQRVQDAGDTSLSSGVAFASDLSLSESDSAAEEEEEGEPERVPIGHLKLKLGDAAGTRNVVGHPRSLLRYRISRLDDDSRSKFAVAADGTERSPQQRASVVASALEEAADIREFRENGAGMYDGSSPSTAAATPTKGAGGAGSIAGSQRLSPIRSPSQLMAPPSPCGRPPLTRTESARRSPLRRASVVSDTTAAQLPPPSSVPPVAIVVPEVQPILIAGFDVSKAIAAAVTGAVAQAASRVEDRVAALERRVNVLERASLTGATTLDRVASGGSSGATSTAIAAQSAYDAADTDGDGLVSVTEVRLLCRHVSPFLADLDDAKLDAFMVGAGSEASSGVKRSSLAAGFVSRAEFESVSLRLARL